MADGLKRLAKVKTQEGNIERHSRVAELLAIAYNAVNQAKTLVPPVPTADPKSKPQSDIAVAQLAEASDLIYDVYDVVRHYVNKNIR